jgi:ferredoxin-NADP reductase/MOSC domain-containing protein YiiM
MTASLVSVNVGLPRDVAWGDQTVYTGVWKHAVEGPRMVRRLNIDGDGQGDLAGHGGEQRAVLVYQLDSYEHWQRHFGRDGFELGQFGENFTVEGLPDDEVCIGDRFRIGEAEFEVTQPRVTCFRVGMRMGEPQLAALLVAHHRPGFYLRVLREGRVEAGDEIVQIAAGPGGLSVAETSALLYLPDRDLDKVRTALAIPALSPGWQQSFRELLDADARGIAADAAGPREHDEPAWTGFRPMRVARIVRETASVSSILLEPLDGAELPRALAGQYLTLRIPDAGEPAPVRNYSLSSAPGAAAYRLSVKREPHGVVSGYLHASLREGAVLDVAAPRGDFVLDEREDPLLFVSAGIGVTPMLAMLHQLAHERSERELWWIHTARARPEHAFADEAGELLAALPNACERIFYTAAHAGDAGRPEILAGRPSAERLAQLGMPADASAYVCGPAAFMTDMVAALADLGVAESAIHTELFVALPPINPGVRDARATPPHPPPGPTGDGPLITFARSGLAVRWSPAWRSLLELADACDVPTRWSCRTGVCHTCATARLSGEVDYAPTPLEPPGADEVLVCCAQPVTELVLDL